MKKDIFLSLGTNIGDLEANLSKAVELLRNRFEGVKVSKIYKTPPVDYEDQEMFYNCCVYFRADILPFDLLEITQQIQRQIGQFEKEVRFGPRLIDLDILFMGNEVVNTKRLVIPHERMHKRAFVLIPMKDLDEDFVHPVLKKSIKEIAEDKIVQEQGIKIHEVF